jgi:hypothetical protein
MADPANAVPVGSSDPNVGGAVGQKEALVRSSVVQTTIIGAGEVFGISQYAERFYFVNATSLVYAKTEYTAERPYKKGTGEKFTTDLRFHRLEIRNPNAYPVFVQVWVGFGEYLDTTSELVEQYTQILGYSSRTIAGVTSIDFPGTPAGTQIQRKCIIVSNDDLVNSLYIVDAFGNYCCTVRAGFSITLPISGPVSVANDTASPISVSISEIYYVFGAS